MRSRRRTLTGLALLALFVSVEALAPLPQFHRDCNELSDLLAAAAAAAGSVSSGHFLASAQVVPPNSPFNCPACMLLGMALVGRRPIAGVRLPTIASRTVSRPVLPHHVSVPHPFQGRAPPAA
jgi:hypothetical protein